MATLASAASLRLPEQICSPLAQSTLTLQRFSGSTKELEAIYKTLSNPKLWEGGYDLSGRLIDITDNKGLRAAIEELWLSDGLELMVIRDGDNFAGVTGVMDWSCGDLPAWNVLTGRTVISVDYWGTKVNSESKVMLYDEIFKLGVNQIECTVSCTNNRSLAAVQKFGFTELRQAPKLVDGVLKNFTRFGLPTGRWSNVFAQNLDRINIKLQS